MAKDNSQQNENTPNKGRVVSVKLDSYQVTKLEQEAAEKGCTVSELMRLKLEETKAETKKVLPPVEAGAAPTPIATLTDESLLNIASIVSNAVKGSLPQSIEVSTPVEPNVEREYLRKIAGLPVEDLNTLTVEEEKFLTDLNEANKADLRTNFLKAENSILFPFEEGNPIGVNMAKEMIAKREATNSEKVPSLTSIFQNAIAEAFFEDAKSLYNKGLFRATYGFEYSELKAVFEK